MIKKADAYVQDFVIKYEEILSDLEPSDSFANDEKVAFVDTVIFICDRLIAEVKEIVEMRHAKSELAFTAVIKEQDQKWKAIVRRLAKNELPFNIHPDAFQKVWNQFHSNMMKHD